MSFFRKSGGSSRRVAGVAQKQSIITRTIKSCVAGVGLHETRVNCTEFRVDGLSKASIPWIKMCSKTFWRATKGIINNERCDALRAHRSEAIHDIYARRKVMNFATAFLKYLAKTHFDTPCQAF